MSAPRSRAPRARPPMRRGLKRWTIEPPSAARVLPRARPPMRRGLKPGSACTARQKFATAARAAPYEKGTETRTCRRPVACSCSRARGPL